jgi:hypothetical protein
MKMTIIAAAALVTSLLVTSFVMPVFAANEFYLVQDTATKQCSVVEARPVVDTTTVLGNVHKTRVEAEAAMKADKSCTMLS